MCIYNIYTYTYIYIYKINIYYYYYGMYNYVRFKTIIIKYFLISSKFKYNVNIKIAYIHK